jgi:hypothetical protein
VVFRFCGEVKIGLEEFMLRHWRIQSHAHMVYQKVVSPARSASVSLLSVARKYWESG